MTVVVQTLDASCCCPGCPADCDSCPPLAIAISSLAGNCQPSPALALTRTGCVWSASKIDLSNMRTICIATDVQIGCNPATNNWYISVGLASCCADLLGVAEYYLEIGKGACPPKGSYNVPLVAADPALPGWLTNQDCCANSITVVLS